MERQRFLALDKSMTQLASVLQSTHPEHLWTYEKSCSGKGAFNEIPFCSTTIKSGEIAINEIGQFDTLFKKYDEKIIGTDNHFVRSAAVFREPIAPHAFLENSRASSHFIERGSNIKCDFTGTLFSNMTRYKGTGAVIDNGTAKATFSLHCTSDALNYWYWNKSGDMPATF